MNNFYLAIECLSNSPPCRSRLDCGGAQRIGYAPGSLHDASRGLYTLLVSEDRPSTLRQHQLYARRETREGSQTTVWIVSDSSLVKFVVQAHSAHQNARVWSDHGSAPNASRRS